MTDLQQLETRILQLLETDSKRLMSGVTIEIQSLQAAALVAIARELHELNAVSLLAIADRLRDLIHELHTARQS